MEMLSWGVAGPAIGAAFLASVVEVVEAFTIVLAVATLRGWRPAVLGTVGALCVLILVVLGLGPVLDRIPIHILQLVIGVLLLVFGMGWLRKAILRSAGVLALHDEEAIFARESAALQAEVARKDRSLDWIAGLTAFKAVRWRVWRLCLSSLRWAQAGRCCCRPPSGPWPPAPPS